MTFDDLVAYSLVMEDAVCAWLRRKGWLVLPTRDLGGPDSGAYVQLPEGGRLILPDILAFTDTTSVWVEVKRKQGPSWATAPLDGGKPGWVTGLNSRHLLDYGRVAHRTGIPVMVLWLHDKGCCDRDSSTEPGAGRVYGWQVTPMDGENEGARMAEWQGVYVRGSMTYFRLSALVSYGLTDDLARR